MKAKPFLVAAPAALALVLAGCGGSTGDAGTDGASAAPKDCSSADVFCIGLVTDTGSVDDKSFNQAAWEGVKALEGDGVQTKYIETKDAKDYAANLKQFTDQKYDAIVTVGFLMTEATQTAAKANTTTKFIGVDQFQEVTVDNVTGLVFPEANAGYAAGYLAGLLTKTNKIGVVLGQEIPPTQNYAKGYELGSKAANPKVTVAKVYHPAGDNAFSDSPWGAGEAKKMLAQGSDIIFGAGGGTGNGALGETAKTTGAGTSLYCIGVDLDQWDTVPEAHPCLVTSAEKKLTDGTTDLLKQAKDGSIKGGNFDGKTGLAGFHDFDSKIPAEVKTKVADVVKGIEDGSIKVG